MYFSKIKEKNGITLVALVITIIVLLILAGVTITMILGENGILTRARDAKEKQKIEEAREEIILILGAKEMDYVAENLKLDLDELKKTDKSKLQNSDFTTFQDDLRSKDDSAKVYKDTSTDSDGTYIKVKYRNYEFKIYDDLSVKYIGKSANTEEEDDDDDEVSTQDWDDGLPETPSNYFSYDSETGTKITGFSTLGLEEYNEGLDEIVIPTKHDDITIVEISDNAFKEKTGIVTLVIPDSVTTIGGGAFYGCTGIENVKIPITANVAKSTSAYRNGFMNTTSVKNAIVSKGTNGEGGDYTRNKGMPWSYGSDVKIEIESGVTKIGKNTFAGDTGIKTVTIPSSVTTIGESAFNGCTNLSSSINFQNVTTIDSKAFYGCTSLSGKVKLGNGMTVVSQEAFRDCPSITEVEIPDTVTAINGGAFYCCTGIKKIKMPITANIAKNTSAYLNGFMNTTSVEDVILTSGSNGQGCDYSRDAGTPWAYGSDVNIVIESGVTKIGKQTFSGSTGIKSVTVPSSVVEIGESAFNGCSNLSSSIDFQNVTSLGNKAFYGCANLSGKVKLGNGMTIVSQESFRGCSSITELEIPDTVTAINGGAFFECSGLERVKMPITANVAKSTSSTGNGFMNTTSVKNVTLTAGSNGEGCDYTRNKGMPWSYGTDVNIVIESGVTKIGAKTFDSDAGIKIITLPNSLTVIGDNAFSGCSGLATVNYYGNSTSWGSIAIGSNNTYLTNATRNYL